MPIPSAAQPADLQLADFDYALPPDRIASHPPEQRTRSRLLRMAGDALSDHRIGDLPDFVDSGDVMVFNDTRVIKARLYGEKATGGRIEVLVERLLPERHVLAQLRASKPPRPGMRLRLEGAIEATFIGRHGDMAELRLEGHEDVLSLLERYGRLPLPPYIERPADDKDDARYQTVYAREPGAVAAPTAGLHFDAPLLEALRARGVVPAWLTLHVGAGTFQPVRTTRIADHHMHAERYSIPLATVQAIATARAAGRRVIAVGTTSLRALEAAAQHNQDDQPIAGAAETDIFITPGYRFRVVDRLLTNFHLPKSTLLMLVSAFAGLQPIRRAYDHAIASGYRFFSYGDAMLIDRADTSRPPAGQPAGAKP
jgi:S-adenosylmethionine:tRNA ribosyltransferase-isomerase